jgi:hypothetical protein
MFSNFRIRLSIGIVLIFFAGSALWALWQAYTTDDKSGWIQVACVVVEIPVVALGFWMLIQEIREQQEKPDISIGISESLSVEELEKGTPIEVAIEWRQNLRPQFCLVVHNNGKRAIKSVKMYLQFIVDPSKPSSPYLKPTVKGNFVENNSTSHFVNTYEGEDYVFVGGSGWALYPRETSSFQFSIWYHPSDVYSLSGEYKFRLTIWAEGLDEPKRQDLIVRIIETAKT